MKLARLLVAAIAAATLGAPGAALGQASTKVHRIGFINVGPAGPNSPNVEAFQAGLRELGYVEGRNIIVDYRWADGKVERLPGLVNELLSLRPEVIVSAGGLPTIVAVKAATTTVPVVFITGDPVHEGLVASLAKPGGNLTGLAVLAEDLEAKRVELLKAMLPKATRVAVVWNPAQRVAGGTLKGVETAAARLGMTIYPFEARNVAELDGALAAISPANVDALMVLADPVLGFERARIVNSATKGHLPAIYFWREFAEIGGLMSYGASLTAVYGRIATYIDKILKGANPAELPIEQPTKFELVINLKTATALGIAVPQSLLLRADEVIPE